MTQWHSKKCVKWKNNFFGKNIPFWTVVWHQFTVLQSVTHSYIRSGAVGAFHGYKCDNMSLAQTCWFLIQDNFWGELPEVYLFLSPKETIPKHNNILNKISGVIFYCETENHYYEIIICIFPVIGCVILIPLSVKVIIIAPTWCFTSFIH